MNMFSYFRRQKKIDSDDVTEIFPLGPIGVPFEDTTQHFAMIGATGSGKTICMRMLMQEVMAGITPGSDRRALVYDAKQDMPSLLHGMDVQVPLKLLNPFDNRGVAWDIARDVNEPRIAIEIVFTLMPELSENTPFFSDAARHLTYAVILSFMKRKLHWTLGDIIRGLSSQKLLRRILAATPVTKSFLPRYCYDKRLLANILTTAATKIMPFEPLAGAWEAVSERVSLEDWVQGSSVLVLGNSETSRHAIDAINRCIVKRAVDLTLQQGESFTRRSWFFLDEITEAGRLDGLVSLCKKGRSKGACVVMALQSIAGLRNPRLYGPDTAAEILGQIGHRFIGRLECPETAEWAARLFGDQEVMQVLRSDSFSHNSQSRSTSHSQQVTTRKAVMPAEFMSVPACNDVKGMTGYYLSQTAGAFRHCLDADLLFGELLDKPSSTTPNFILHDIESQYLAPWSPEQEAIFAPRLQPSRKTSQKPKVPPRPSPRPHSAPKSAKKPAQQRDETDLHDAAQSPQDATRDVADDKAAKLNKLLQAMEEMADDSSEMDDESSDTAEGDRHQQRRAEERRERQVRGKRR